MKFLNVPSPSDKILSVDKAPLSYTLIHAIVPALAGAMAIWVSKKAVDAAMDMETVTFDWNDRIQEEDPEDEPVTE